MYNLNFAFKHAYFIASLPQLTLWQRVFTFKVNIGQRVANPLREDNHKGCWLSYALYDDSIIVLNDFAHRQYHGMNVVRALAIKQRITTLQVIHNLQKEFIECCDVSKAPQILKKYRSTFTKAVKKEGINYIGIEESQWKMKDKEYWQRYDITIPQLIAERVVPVNAYNIGGKRVVPQQRTYWLPAKNPSFNYTGKLYSPSSTRVKWLGNMSEHSYWYSTVDFIISDTLFITSSFKDNQVVLNTFHKDTLALQAEGTLPTAYILLTIISQYSNIVIFYDNDKAGITYSTLLHSFLNSHYPLKNISKLFTDESDFKDPSDYSEQYGQVQLYNLWT